ncbi:hypothetical protein ASE01_15825 [Nocardioides sp. Root190]|uniref:RCC1 domain-containing protein n=1 Tax=Nocardioides sp. Root190 TaxID=1736488 RepID=UPI0006FF0DB4|nr:hypothetical protein [Nocardioides sp. Root190]KRB76431.1 hypothetical protein ASE01_15825 [Nocardioides sp. Root190]
MHLFAHPRRGTLACLSVLLFGAALLVAAPTPAVSPPGTPYAWGGNVFGELGDGTTSPHRTAAPVTGLSDVVDLHTGREHTVALRADGTVMTWGSNQMGQLGGGTTGGLRPAPAAVAGLTDVVMVSTGHYHSLALRADGSVWTWGYNHVGQLGDGTTTNRNRPVLVSGTRTYSWVAAGRDMSYAVATDGSVWAWGLNGDGQLGDGTTTNRAVPVQVGGLSDIVQVSGGRDHGLALAGDGTVWAWGWNAYGQLGDGTLTDRLSPVQVTTGARMVASGAHHSYALRSDGRVLAWGRNYRNELGDGTTTQRTRPVLVSGVAGAVAIGSGRDHGLAALADGTVRSWGHNSSGQLGDGTVTSRSTAVTALGVTGASRVSGGAEFSVALSTGTPPPTGENAEFRASAGATRNASSIAVRIPAAVQTGDALVLFVSTNRLASFATPTGWTLLATASDSDLRSWAFTRTAASGSGGTTLTLTLDAMSKVVATVVAYRGGPVTTAIARIETGTGAAHLTAPTTVSVGSAVLHHWSTKINSTATWSLPPELTQRHLSPAGSGSGQVSAVTAGGVPAATGTWPSRTATASVASGKAIGWTVVIPPVS